MKQVCTLVLLLWSTLAGLYAQQNYPLHLKTTALSAQSVAVISQQSSKQTDWSAHAYGDRYYLILQFQEIPTQAERAALLVQGVRLLDYLPERAFLASVPLWLRPNDIRAEAILPVSPSYKISPQWANQWAEDPKVGSAAIIHPMPDIIPEQFIHILQTEGFFTTRQNGRASGTFNQAAIQQLSNHPAVLWIEPASPTPTPEGLAANASMQANWLTQAPSDGYDGTGTAIGIADDGSVSHPDVQGRLITPPTVDWGSHGDMTVGIAAGAGNLDPRAIGLAPGAEVQLSMISGYPHITNAVSRYQQYNVSITSTSYGEGCGGYYNSNAQFLDAQVHDHPYLLHLFSAGNSGGSSCNIIYGGIQGPGNTRYGGITGGYKASKNGMAVGNATFGDVLMASSSRGPVEDGRIKPDICAIGQGSLTTGSGNSYRLGSGTSAAAPAVAGITADLTQAYQENIGGQPSSALLKACLLNGAKDMGRPGPDYETGWGMVRGKQSLEMIENQQYFTASVGNGGSRTHNLYIPPGAKEVKVMLYWHDQEGSPWAAKALVNDLGLRAIAPSGAVNYPLVLSTFPTLDSITRPAEPGTDHVNNMEQVYLANPSPGNYTLQVVGEQVPQGPQDYTLVYHWVTEELSLTYPMGGEALVPGEQVYVTWDAISDNGSFLLQYSTNGGASWQTAISSVPGYYRQIAWGVPNTVSSNCQVRISRSGHTSTSMGSFTIMETPVFHLSSAGLQSAQVSWLPVNGASSYEVFQLNGSYMEPMGTTTSNSMTVPATVGAGKWYSVRAKGNTGNPGRRAFAQYYEHYDCDGQLQLRLNLDNAPTQTSWLISNASGEIMASGGPYNASAALQQIDIPLCLPNGCYSFIVSDSGNNGMCCQYGSGSYTLTNNVGQVLASGSSFGATASHSICVDQVSSPFQVNTNGSLMTSCHGSNDGWAVANPTGGTPPYNYLWNNGAQTQQINGLTSGVYQVTVSDNYSSITAQVYIGSPSPLSIDIVTESTPCGETDDGSASAVVAGGTPPYTYAWSNGSTGNQITQVPSAYYQVTVTDANGCTANTGSMVYSSSTIDISVSHNPPSCAGYSNGYIEVDIAGGSGNYQYQWSTGSTQHFVTNVGAGLYTVTVTDNNGCSGTRSIAVAAPQPLSVLTNVDNDNQWAGLSVSGGTSPYGYLWPDGGTSASRSGLSEGTYEVTVTDTKNCTAIATVAITGPADEYCQSQGEQSFYNWIQEISLGSMTSSTGNNQGYASFVSDPTKQPQVTAGQSYPLTLVPGYAFGGFNLQWRVYVDWNEDRDFDDSNELIFASPNTPGTHTAQLILPAATAPGPKRVRVSMAFGPAPAPCEAILYGEVEDYTIIVVNESADYCSASGTSTSQEWIQEVRLGDIGQLSGNDGGYGDYTNQSLYVEPGQTVPFLLVPGYLQTPYPEHWSVWIDSNQDGTFDATQEMVYHIPGSVGPISGQLDIPDNIMPGLTRIRVMMRWDDGLDGCGDFAWGEVEDYTLVVGEGGGTLDGPSTEARTIQSETSSVHASAKVWPNPSAGPLHFSYVLRSGGPVSLQLTDALGREQQRYEQVLPAGTHLWATDCSTLPNGYYTLRLQTADGEQQFPVVVQR